MSNLYDYLLRSDVKPEHVVLTTQTGDVWTKDRMVDLAARFATVLQNSGMQPGDRLAAQVEKSPEAICLFLACLKVGAVWIPLNTAYTRPEADIIIGDANPAVVVWNAPRISNCAGKIREFDLGADGRGGLIDAASSVQPMPSAVRVRSDDLAAILYTSGTTGRPKGAMLTHANLQFSAQSLVSLWAINDSDVLLHALPIFHAHGLFIAACSMMRAGGTMVLLQKFDVSAVLENLPRSTVFMGVPTFYTRLLADPRLTKEVCANVRLFTCGSAPLSSATFEEFRKKTGHDILERYGMTETTIIASNPYEGARIPETVGFALPGVTAVLRGAKGAAVPTGEIGELVLKGPNVFKGYWGMPDLTAKEFTADGFFKTGDLATIDQEGRIAIVGRNKDLIISGGYNVYPQEIEAALNDMAGIQDSAVIGIPHPDFGEGVVAVIESGNANLDATAVLAELNGRLAKYKIPKKIYWTTSLPRNALGKVQKNELRKSYASAFEAYQ